MKIFYWWTQAYCNFFSIKGRAPRAELWSFHLGNLLIFGLLFLARYYIDDLDDILAFNPLTVFTLITVIPTITVSIRRFHDRGHSIFWFLFTFIPYIGVLFALVQWILPSKKGTNKYGPNPLEPIEQPTKEVEKIS